MDGKRRRWMICCLACGLLVLLTSCRGSGKSSTSTAATPTATIASTAVAVVGTPESTSTATPLATPSSTLRATPTATATPRPPATPTPAATPVASPAATPTPNLGVPRTPTPTDKVKAQLAKNVTSDYQPVEPTNVFTTDASKIYLAFTTTDLPPDSMLSSVWIAEKVDADVPPNYVIDRADLKVSGSQSGDFSLTRPTAGFPTGSYRVDLYLSGTLIGSYAFTIK
jgi:hypothetical protein